ncbi:hypothetical protein Tsubulata_013853 [Turnera subulata]|uniref:ENTH domain-containing protein n=1 Tax=Turnera subulata TaxID=218843 RepID=A0A9Q0JJF6_9ROSI|nr:hypothetical protein Tsubulata_013853 [Turnera subulata]
MPSKLRKAIGAVKDQTSISLAKVSSTNASNLEVLILKATRHDAAPIDERYVNEVLSLVSSNKVYAAACAQAIAKRIGKTKNWIVALKSLMLVLRIFQDGDPYFPREILHVMKRGGRVLNLSTFKDDSNSNPWDYTTFVRKFALYLDERLDCFLTGKLQRRFTKRETDKSPHRNRRTNDSISEMKPPMLLDKIAAWQRLLDKAIVATPTGATKNNRLVLIALYAIVQESFDLYRDISDGLAHLLDSFFQLPYQSCVNAFKTCVKASKQYEELCSYYDLCQSIGIGRTSEYPSVQKVSEELIDTLKEFLKDQDSLNHIGQSPPLLLPSVANESFSSADKQESEPAETTSIEYGSQCASLEDLMGSTDTGTSPTNDSIERSFDLFFEERYQIEDGLSVGDSCSSLSLAADKGSLSTMHSGLDLVSLDGWPLEDQKQEAEQGNRTPEVDICSIHSSAVNSAFDLVSLDGWPAEEQKQEAEQGNRTSGLDSCSVLSFPADHETLSAALDNVSLDGWPLQDQKESDETGQQMSTWDLDIGEFDDWEAAFSWHESQAIEALPHEENGFGTNTLNNVVDQDTSAAANGFEAMAVSDNNFYDPTSTPEQQYNPFLQDTVEIPATPATAFDQTTFEVNDAPSVAPTFQAIPASLQNASLAVQVEVNNVPSAAPTFQAIPASPQNASLAVQIEMNDTPSAAPTFQAIPASPQNASLAVKFEDDPFAPFPADGCLPSEPMSQQNVLQQQQLWLQNQERIIAKNVT